MLDHQASHLESKGKRRSSHFLSTRMTLSAPLAFPPMTLEMLASLLDFSPDALFVVDEVGTLALLNTQMEVLFGYGQEELIGQPVEILLPQRLHALHEEQRKQYMYAPHARPMGAGLNLVGRRKDGSEFPVDISLRPARVNKVLYILGAVRDMTAQRQAVQERLRFSERLRRQDQLINLSHDAIIVHDPDGSILSWNRGAEDLYGWKEHEVRGKMTSDVLSTRFPLPLPIILQCLERDDHWDGDLVHCCRDGREVMVESRWALMRNEAGVPTEILEINRDMTERHRLEAIEQEARAETKARLDVLQHIVDHLPAGVFLVHGPQLRLLLANRAVNDLWRAEWREDQPFCSFLEEHHLRLFTEDGRPLLSERLAMYQAMMSGEPILRCQQVLRRPDGASLPLLVDAIPLDLFQTAQRLPTEIVKTLISSERVVLVVYQNVEALKEAEMLKDQFVSLAAHELRTPVTVMVGYADLLLRTAAKNEGYALDDQLQTKLRTMKDAAHHLAKLTEELLDVTRVQAGQFHLQREATDLIALARKVIEQIQATTDRHQLTLQTSLASLRTVVDASRIEQVLSNLLINAIKYSPQGGPVEVTLWKTEKTGEVCFRVRDQGMGIPKEQQARIFGRFVRADNARLAGINGTGLGLYLCRELVERHGGSICFESEANRGSTFFFSLPCEDANEEKPAL